MSLFAYLGSLFAQASAKSESGAAPAAPPRDVGPDAAPRNSLDSPEFAHKLRHLFHQQHDLMVSGIHIIGLAQVRTHFGAQWPRMEERVQAIARAAIERRLSAEDVYATFQDSAFVIVFARLSKAMAQMKCALIADEIAKKVFGSEATPQLIEVATSVVKPSGDFELDRLDLGRALLGAAHAAVANDTVHEVVPGSADQAISRLARTADGKPVSDPQPTPSADTKDGDAKGGDSRMVSENQWRPLASAGAVDAETERLRLAQELLAALPPRESKLFSFGQLDFVYRPVWLVKKRVTSAHVCIPARVTSEGTPLFGGGALLSSPGSPVNTEYDIACLKKVRSELLCLEMDGLSAVLVVPVHLLTIADNRRRMPYMDLLRQFPDRLRRKLLFEVISIPPGIPQRRVLDAVSILGQVSNNILFRVRLDCKDFSIFAMPGVYAVGVDIMNFRVGESIIIPMMNGFVERAGRLGFRTYIHGLRTPSLVSAAVCAGFDYVDGDPVTSVVQTPLANKPFDVADLYESVIARTDV